MKCVYNDKLQWSEGTDIVTQYREIHLYQTGENMDVTIQKVTEAFAKIMEIIRGVFDAFREAFESIFGCIYESIEKEELKRKPQIPRLDIRPVSNQFKMDHQVLDRKPFHVRARNNL